MEDDDRYQHQPWYVKLWRCRWLLLVPWNAYESYKQLSDDVYPLSFRNSWDLATGMAHAKMKWYYSAEELGWKL